MRSLPRGQTIELPQGHYNRIYILAASSDGDQKASFQVDDAKVDLNIQDWTGFIGQWDTRLWKNQSERDWAISANHAVWPPADLQQREQRPASPRYPEDYVGLQPGYVKPADPAWYASHQHTADGLNQPYQLLLPLCLSNRSVRQPKDHSSSRTTIKFVSSRSLL